MSMQSHSPAQLHHLHITSPDPDALARFYSQNMDLQASLEQDRNVLRGGSRAAVISSGPAGLLYPAYVLRDAAALDALATRLARNGVAMQGIDDPLLQAGAFSIADPQGRLTVYGLARAPRQADAMPARLQHAVFQTTQLDEVVRFYVEQVGFTVSDEGIDEESGRVMVVFLRSDDEHHSLAFFRGSRNEWDHHCYETDEWNNIRDWGDRFARLRIPIFFGPGRHGPGNNLFFMVTDPDGNRLEISAELDRVAIDATPGVWPHNEYTLNSWGRAWIRT
ncbi:VOC family protein [Herbaspirillum huttiense]|uniref:VOC family protein n=1 Tax=Herbaspirillum huttiense TaxID=863372 RepID=UPI0003FF7EA9|nr:VOC family protein [Herbaspirillum huttiense]